jgi:hypothetical protein
VIQFHVDVAPINKALGEFGKQVSFAAAQSLNDAAREFQQAQLAHERTIFKIRRPQFFVLTHKITHRATKQELWADVAIVPPGGAPAYSVDAITRFESDTEHTPFHGTHIVVPIGPNAGKIQREGQRLRDFNLRAHGSGFVGDQGVFAVRLDAQRLLVLQRFDRGRRFKRHGKTVSVKARDSTPIFLLVPRVRIRPELHFYENAAKTLQPAFERAFLPRLANAIATAK